MQICGDNELISNVSLQNELNISNNNFVPAQALNLTVQALNFETVVGKVFVKNVASVKPLSLKTVRPKLTMNPEGPESR